MQSSAALRRQLTLKVRELDPPGTDPALRSMVLVGHSMGGLHAKLQVVDPGDALWDAICTVPFDQVRLRPEIRAFLRQTYFFEPVPFVKRAVFIATPHRGSILASLGVGRLASLAVRSPPRNKAIHAEVVSLNPGAFRPEYERAAPTTIDLLEPKSSLLQAIEKLRVPCWVTCHSIVGNGHHSLTGGRDDCVVSVASAHTPFAVSEIQVPATHTKVHHHPTTLAELKRILLQHLAEIGR
jgi:triacylglycerol esterase/lipase EstA (alpha/beta hydrolase family)